MSKLIIRLDEGELKVHRESEKEYDIIKRSEVERLIKEKIGALKRDMITEPVGQGESKLTSSKDHVVPSKKPKEEEESPQKRKERELGDEDFGGRRIEYDIV